MSYASVTRTLLFPMRPDLDDGELGQTRLRFLGGLAFGTVLLLAHWTGAFGDLSHGVMGMVLYVTFGYIWGLVVATDVVPFSVRQLAVIVLDEAILSWGFWYSGSNLSLIIWMPIFMTAGNGLRYGTKLAYFSASVASVFLATAFIFSPYWRLHEGIAFGLVIGTFVVPVYVVSLNLRLQRRQREAELRAAEFEEANRTDALTGIANRLGFSRALQRLVEDGRDFGGRGGVFYIDLDGFKAVNDEAGHAAGDEVLKTVAKMLRNSVRSNDIVARLGGDEFAIVARGLATAHDSRNMSATMQTALATIRIPKYEHLRIGATMGICLLPHPGVLDGAEATRLADELMLAGKKKRKGSVSVVGYPDPSEVVAAAATGSSTAPTAEPGFAIDASRSV